MKRKAVDIVWDTDGEAIDLPSEMEIPDDIPDEEIENWLSDQTGFCMECFWILKNKD